MSVGLLGIEELTRPEVEAILERARFYQPVQTQPFKKLDTLRGKMIVNLFFEASTRTRTSFEIAAKRLGADAVSITAQASSVSKGESLVDTLNTLAAMRPNAIVMERFFRYAIMNECEDVRAPPAPPVWARNKGPSSTFQSAGALRETTSM